MDFIHNDIMWPCYLETNVQVPLFLINRISAREVDIEQQVWLQDNTLNK